MSVKPAPKRKAAAKKVAAARGEVQPPADRTVTFRDLEITVPPATDWGSEIYFLLGDIKDAEGFEATQLSNDVLKEIIGADQFGAVRSKLRADKVKMHEVESEMVALFNAIFAEFGTGLGESNASPDS